MHEANSPDDVRRHISHGVTRSRIELELTRARAPLAVYRAAPLPMDRVKSSVNVADVLDVFDADTRVRLRNLLDGFGNGLKGRGDSLRDAFVTLTPLLQTARRATRQIDIRETRTRRLVHN